MVDHGSPLRAHHDCACPSCDFLPLTSSRLLTSKTPASPEEHQLGENLAEGCLLMPHIPELGRPVLKIRSNRFHLMWFANEAKDDLPFGCKVLGGTRV